MTRLVDRGILDRVGTGIYRTLDLDEINIKKLSMTTLRKFAKRFPGYTQKYLKKDYLVLQRGQTMSLF